MSTHRNARRLTRVAAALLMSLLLGPAGAARADSVNPLRPVDTSSPRATLQGFNAAVDTIFDGWLKVLGDYAASDRLYLGPEERRMQKSMRDLEPRALRALDLSGVLPLLRDTVGIERGVQLKDILDRIPMPPLADVPDSEVVQRLGLKRWRLPDTEIDFVLIDQGPRAGEWLVSAETVARLPEFYRRVSGLPYKPGPAKNLAQVLATLNGGQQVAIYEELLNSPVGLGVIVPPRWILQLPAWTRARVAEVSVWQWAGVGIGLGVSLLIVLAANRLGRRLRRAGEDEASPIWRALPLPVAIVIVTGAVVPVFSALQRIGGTVRVLIFYLQTGLLYLAAAWLAIIGAVIVGDVIVASEHLRRRSLDSQLIKLSLRFIGVAGAVGFLIQGADELGFPAYSVIAGLGVGGLAVALAARDSIANLLGSVLILIEKPFRVGHHIKVAGNEGAVEDVGFRSTRIRTPENSLISIPNNVVVNTTIENMTLRPSRRQRFFVRVPYGTPRDKVEALAGGVQALLGAQAAVNQKTVQVRLNNFGDDKLEILVQFHLDVADSTAELREREAVLLRIMALAEELGVPLAPP